MKNLAYILFFLCVVVVSCFVSCTSKQQTPQSNNTATAPPVSKATVLPLYPLASAQQLFENADHLDMTFTNLSFSINMSEVNQVKGIIASLLSTNQPPHMNCQYPFGLVSIQGDGKVLAEADIYFENGCTYLVFRENKQYAYTCAIPAKGIEFLNQMIANQQRMRSN